MQRYPSFGRGWRHVLATIAITLLVATAFVPAARAQSFLDVGKQEPITILINSSPWYAGFENVVKLYEQQTPRSSSSRPDEATQYHSGSGRPLVSGKNGAATMPTAPYASCWSETSSATARAGATAASA